MYTVIMTHSGLEQNVPNQEVTAHGFYRFIENAIT